MPLYEEFDRYYAETQRGQKVALRDRGETIQAKLPVEDGEVILTQTRIYLAVGEAGESVPSIRLERAEPRVNAKEEWLEVAPRMGARLHRGQTAREFLQIVDLHRRAALERAERAREKAADGVRRHRAALLERAEAHGRAGERRKMKDLLRTLHADLPEDPVAATRLAEAYVEEGNHRAALRWFATARVFDARFDQCLTGVLEPRLPSREVPPPERWFDRHLTPLLSLPEGDGAPDAEQRRRIQDARARITRFRTEHRRASPAGIAAFALAVVGWVFLVFLAPWLTLGVTATAAVTVGIAARLRQRGRRRPRR